MLELGFIEHPQFAVGRFAAICTAWVARPSELYVIRRSCSSQTIPKRLRNEAFTFLAGKSGRSLGTSNPTLHDCASENAVLEFEYNVFYRPLSEK
jgi:hypothetical protein